MQNWKWWNLRFTNESKQYYIYIYQLDYSERANRLNVTTCETRINLKVFKYNMELKLTHWEMTGAPWCAASCDGKGLIVALHELIPNFTEIPLKQLINWQHLYLIGEDGLQPRKKTILSYLSNFSWILWKRFNKDAIFAETVSGKKSAEKLQRKFLIFNNYFVSWVKPTFTKNNWIESGYLNH